jgi:hypothetical protein
MKLILIQAVQISQTIRDIGSSVQIHSWITKESFFRTRRKIEEAPAYLNGKLIPGFIRGAFRESPYSSTRTSDEEPMRRCKIGGRILSLKIDTI